MAQETFLRDATLSQLTEALISKSDEIYLQLERPPSHLRGTGSHTAGGMPPWLQHIGQREPKHSTSSCELTNTLWTTTSRISSSINETRVISRLPPEMLAEVFRWYQYLESHKWYRWYTWVKLTSVSHAWRSTILSFPSLWSTAYLSGEIPPGVIRTLLQRSGRHLLDVIIPMRYRPTPRFNRDSHALEVSAHTSRIRKFISYKDYSGNGMNHLVRIFHQPAPNLTHLELCDYQPFETIPFPNLFGLEFPKLRNLEVTRVNAWPEIVGANLTHITINSFLDPYALNQCIPYSPNLKVLKLRSIWNLNRLLSFSTWKGIALPPGIRFTIGSSTMCPEILALFSLPQDCHLKVNPSMYTVPDKPLLSYVLPDRIVSLQNLRTLTRLHIAVRFNIGVGLRLKCFRLDQVVFEVSTRFSADIPTMVEQNGTPVMWFLNNLHRIVLRGVEELRMEGFVGPVEPRAAELLTFLKRMPALSRLITTDANEGIFRSALDNLYCRVAVVRVEG